MILPITPQEAKDQFESNIPDFVFAAVNKLVAANASKSRFVIEQKDIIAEIQKATEITRHEIFDEKFLDFESAYAKFGWEVEYIKGAYYETFEPYFSFAAKK